MKLRIESCLQVKRSRYCWQPATTWRSDSGLRQKDQSGICDNPHLAIFLRAGRELLIISTHWLIVAVSVFIFFKRLLQRYFYGLIFVLPCFETFTPPLLNILTHSFIYSSCVKFTNSRYRSERKRLATISVKMRTTNGRCEGLEKDQKIFLNLPNSTLARQ